MKASKARARLTDYLEGDLAARERSRVEAALQRHPALRQELDELRAMRSLLRRLPEPEPPPFLAERVIARVRAGEAEPQAWWSRLGWLVDTRVVAPIAAGAVGLALFAGLASGPLMVPAEHRPPATEIAARSDSMAVATLPDRRAERLERAGDPFGRGASPAAREVLDRQRERVREMQQRMWRHSMALYAARQGRGDGLSRMLRGAGHPHSAGLADHFEREPTLTLAEYSPRPRRRGR